VALQDGPDARGGDDDAYGDKLIVDAAVAPVRVLLREAEHEGGGPLGDGRSTRSAVGMRPAPGDEVPGPAQQSFWSDEEAPESTTREQSYESRQHRPVRRLERRSVDLASEECHLVAQHDDLDGEIGVASANESDELEGAAERQTEEREGHCWMLAALGSRRQRGGRRPWMTFSAPTGARRPDVLECVVDYGSM
jgi:hypothetical protein